MFKLVLFGDDFSLDLSKWIPVREAWGIVDGQLHVYARNAPALIKTNIGDLWTDCSVEALIVSLGGTYREAGLVFRMLDNANYYRLVVGTEEAGLNQIRRICLHKVVDGVATEISPYRDVQYTCPISLKVDVVDEAEGTRITVYVNGEMVYSWLDPAKTFSAGRAGIYTDQHADFTGDSFVVESLLPFHVLSVNSTPISGYPFTLGEENLKTNWTGSLTEGTYVVTVPTEAQIGNSLYRFVQWEDGSPDRARTISLYSEMAIEATIEYVGPAPTPPAEITLPMIGGIALAVVDTALVAIYLLKHFKVIK